MRLILLATLGADIALRGRCIFVGGIACYLYTGPLGHKPSKLNIALTNPIDPRKPERR